MPWHQTHDSRDKRATAIVAELAERQHGAVSTAQLLGEAGLTRGGIDHWVRTGRLHRAFSGAYAVGHPRLSPFGRLFAAWLATGADAVAGVSAAFALDLLKWPGDPVHLIATTHKRSRPGIRVHRSSSFDPASQVIDVRGLPATAVERTLLDLPRARTHEALRQADYLGLANRQAVQTLLVSAPTHRNAAHLARLADLPRTDSDPELAFLAIVRRAGIPPPATQRRHAGGRRDFLWRDPAFVVEIDGDRAHTGPIATARDKRRDAELLAATGAPTVRFTRAQVVDDPAYVATTLERVYLSLKALMRSSY